MNNNSHTDTLVIGAGASGAAVVWKLARAGFNVVCLEQGDWMNPNTYPPNSPAWEVEQSGAFAFDPNMRQLPQDYPVENRESDVAPLMFNAVGGSTIHWTAHTPRLHPSDFRVRSLDSVADDWPLTYQELEPYYDLNDVMMGCSGVNGDPANPPRQPRQMPPLAIGTDMERIAAAFDQKGWHWWPSDSYINSVEYKGRGVCNYCGPNGLGCVPKAKASTDVTYWPEALAAGAELRTRCRVTRITTSATGEVTGAEYLNADNELQQQTANAVILAANGIGTPRLLLLSKSKFCPNGLANSSGQVGRNLMFHPYPMITGLFPPTDDVQTWKGPQGNSIMSQQFYETDSARNFTRGYTIQLLRSSGPARTAIGTFIDPVPWGANHHDEFARRFGNATTLAIITEDLPEEHNRIELDPRLTDSSGLAAPKVFYKTSENTQNMIKHGIETSTELLKQAGAIDVYACDIWRACGWHLMGTARMGEDPARFVTNKWGATHDHNNLFIVDGSLFTTGGAVNPTPTIQALALRTADYIEQQRADLKG